MGSSKGVSTSVGPRLGKVWNVLEQGERGLTCRGEPRKRALAEKLEGLGIFCGDELFAGL